MIIRIAAACIYLVGLLLMAAFALLYRFDRPQMLPLVRADYQRCATARPPALLRTPRSRVDLIVGKPSNDRGVS